MSTSTSAPNGQQPKGLWASVAPYVASPLVAALGIIPAYSDLATKSCLQTGEPVERRSLFKNFKGGLNLTPTIACTVGVQVELRKYIAQQLKGESTEESPKVAFASDTMTGCLTSPLVAVVNRLANPTIKETWFNAFRASLNAKKLGVITVQETAFLGGLSIAKPIQDAAKATFGNNIVVNAGSAFAGGALGAMAGHFANTTVTRWDKDLKIDHFRQLTLGMFHRARAVGTFCAGMSLWKSLLTPKETN